MSDVIDDQIQSVLPHLYINPLERCNLRCKICYTKKTDPILTKEQILEFIERYTRVQHLQTVTFCGGEVCTLPYFPTLVNTLTDRGIIVSFITNGTIDILEQLTHPNSVNCIVSIDGMESYHDTNRGVGMFQKSMTFLRHAFELEFHGEIFSIVTKQNYPDIDVFEKMISNYFGRIVDITYHPRKPPMYLMHHPVSNITGVTDGFDFLPIEELTTLMTSRHTFPPKYLGCFQIALVSDGGVFGCCEGTHPIGNTTDDIETLIDAMKKRLVLWEQTPAIRGCLGCTQPEFVCGIRTIIEQIAKYQEPSAKNQTIIKNQ